jgi:hypothetical protein
MMSLCPLLTGAVPASTVTIARAAFPRGNLYLRQRDTLGPVFTNQQFAALFPSHGQPAEAPWRLALVALLLQFAENLSGRRAVWFEHAPRRRRRAAPVDKSSSYFNRFRRPRGASSLHNTS